MKRAYFVTGIDTDAGKSIVTGVLARALSARGERVITQKFIQTGCDGLSEDIETHRRIMGIGLLPEDEDGTTCPIVFTYPASPHLAAAIDGRDIDLTLIGRSTEKLLQKYDTVLIEGARRAVRSAVGSIPDDRLRRRARPAGRSGHLAPAGQHQPHAAEPRSLPQPEHRSGGGRVQPVPARSRTDRPRHPDLPESLSRRPLPCRAMARGQRPLRADRPRPSLSGKKAS